jgi:hypothetical protein
VVYVQYEHNAAKGVAAARTFAAKSAPWWLTRCMISEPPAHLPA